MPKQGCSVAPVCVWVVPHAPRRQTNPRRCRLSRKVLADLSWALRVLAHEWCHFENMADGSKPFTDAVEGLLSSAAVAALRGGAK